jgi:hypothetical protein
VLIGLAGLVIEAVEIKAALGVLLADSTVKISNNAANVLTRSLRAVTVRPIRRIL